jgi:ribokinase
LSKIEVVGLGALNIDRVYRVERLLTDGEAVADWAGAFPGGSAANTIYGLSRLGVSAGFTGMVGDDDEGRMVTEDFAAAGVDTSRIRTTPQARTGSVLCLSDRLGRRSLYVTPGANDRLTMDDLDLDYLNRAGLVHLSSFVGEGQFELSLAVAGALNQEVRLSFAPGALYIRKGLKALRPILERTYVLFTNRDEIDGLTGEGMVNSARICLEQGCKIVAVTLGKGARLKLGKSGAGRTVSMVGYVRDTENEYIISAGEGDGESPADTTGAGDAFAAGFLYGLLKGKGLDECGRLGNTVARGSLSQPGARQGLPTPEQLAQRYQELYPKPEE